MSLTTEQVKRLREYAKLLETIFEDEWEDGTPEALCADAMKEAAETITELSEKLHAANMERSSAYYNGGWIPVNERLPELNDDSYVEYDGRYRSEPVLVTYIGYGETTLYTGKCLAIFRDDDLWYWFDEEADIITEAIVKIIAWMPLPEPYKAE